MDFRKMTVADAETVGTLLRSLGELTCESTFINLYIYQELYSDLFALEDGQLFIKSESEDGTFFRLPMGKDLRTGIEKLRDYLGGDYPTFWAPDGELFEQFKELYAEHYDITEEGEDARDYVYSREALSTLSGKKYHSKRNHISAFSKAYDWQYVPISKENLEDIRKCAELWYEENSERLDIYLDGERKGVMLLLDSFSELKAEGGAIYVGGTPVAFTVGSEISETAYNIHIEKALSEYSGAYTVINREFARRLPERIKYINREDDLGLEGLRRAKLSYRPEFFINKYFCKPKDRPPQKA